MSSRDIPIRQLPKTHKSFLMMWGFVSIFCSQKKRRVGSASPLCRQASLHLLCTQLVQWILHNLKSTQLPQDYDKNSMIENYTKKIKTHRRAHRFAPPR